MPLVHLLILVSCIVSHITRDQERRPEGSKQGALVLERLEEREVASGAPHSWSIDVRQGQYVEASVENAGIDVSIAVTSPSGDRTYRFDHAGYAGTQIVRWVADVSGVWTVRLEAIGADAKGRYRIKLGIIRDATDRDRRVAEADQLSKEAGQLQEKGAHAAAEMSFQRALQLVENAAGKDSVDVATVAANLADHYYVAGRYIESSALLSRALGILQKQFGPESPEAGVAMNNLGYMYHMQGRYRDAETLLRRALEIRARLLGWQHPRVGISLDNLASLYIVLGRYAEAELLATRALTVFEKALGADHYYVAFPLRILATIHQDQDQYVDAEPLLKRALSIDEARLGPAHSNFASSLRRLAMNVSHQGRQEEAEALFRRVVAINEKAHGANHPATAASLTDLARVRLLRGDATEARALYERALVMDRSAHGADHPNIALILMGLVRVDLASSTPDLSAARGLIDEAIRMLDGSGGHLAARIDAYALRSQIYRRRQDAALALADLAEALRLVEVLRPQTSGGEEARAGVFEHYTTYFDRMVSWQLEAGSIERAIEYAERGRARAFLDQLAAGQIDLRSSIPPDLRAQLETQESAARSRIAEFQQRINLVRSRAELSNEQRITQINGLETSLREADSEYNRVYALIKDASPLWRDEITTGGRSPSLGTIQRELVPRSGLMLLYQIGAEESQLFVIPPVGQPTFSIPLTATGAQARVMAVDEGNLTSAEFDRILNGVDDKKNARAGLIELVSSLSSRRGLGASSPGLPARQLHALWQVLVPQRVRAQVLAATEIVIVPDGSLHQLPFETLVTALAPNGAALRYWLDDGPITRYAPSAAVLYNLTRRPQARVFPSADSPSVLSLSNPVYSPAEVAALRGAEARRPAPPTTTILVPPRTRNAYERFGGSLSRLPGTAQETEAVLAAFGNDAARSVQVLQDLRADEPGLRRAIAGKRYLHIATHALVGGNRGTLFAALILTPPATESSDPDADGFLQLHEIYELKLSGVELAILSACDTNRGRTIDGEGVFALSRGFLAAGAHRVIGSQWAVNDASTAQLMASLFRQTVDDERHGRAVDHARALRDARRFIRNRPGWSDPYYWAPFVLTGRQ